MHIAFIIVKNIMLGGGIEKLTYELGNRLVKRGQEVTVYSMKHYGDSHKEFGGIKIVRVPAIPMRATEKLSASTFAAFHAFSQKKIPDIIHLHSVAAGAFAWMLNLRGAACVIQMHGIEWKRSRWGIIGKSVLKFLEKWSLRRTPFCTAVSEQQCEFFSREYGISAKYIPTGVEIKSKVPAQEIFKLGLKPKYYILFASRLVKEKGAHYLIPAFRKLNHDVKLVIAGDARGEEVYKEKLRHLAGDDKRIVFPGFVSGRLLEELFSHALIYVQPSELEGKSIALLEAMSYGNPCLVSDIPENIETVGSEGKYFKNKDIQGLKEGLDWLLDNPGAAQNLGQRAKKRVKDKFSWDFVTKEFEDFYHEILNTKRI